MVDQNTYEIADALKRAFGDVVDVEQVPEGYKDAFSVEIQGDTVVGRLAYYVDELPVGKWLEYGTRAHWVEPKVLHPIEFDPDGRFARRRPGRQSERIEKRDNPRGVQAPQALSWVENGKRIFSRGHMVGGIRPRFIMRQTRERFKKIIAGRLKRELEGSNRLG